MKLISLATLILSYSMAAFSSPLLCTKTGEKYSVTLSPDHQTAQVLVDRGRVQFGDLECRAERDLSERRSDLFCTSRGVADAGYSAHFVQLDRDISVSLNEISFFGAKFITSLPCFVVGQN